MSGQFVWAWWVKWSDAVFPNFADLAENPKQTSDIQDPEKNEGIWTRIGLIQFF